jgi:hypothetical protein
MNPNEKTKVLIPETRKAALAELKKKQETPTQESRKFSKG